MTATPPQSGTVDRRRQTTTAAVVVVIAVLAVAAFIALSKRAEDQPVPAPTGTLAEASARVVTSYTAADFDSVTVTADTFPAEVLPKKLTAPKPMTQDGKPVILYVGGEFCPYCAAQRWAMAAALSRFGTFTALPAHTAVEPGAKVPTVTFHGASYRSDYLVFQGVETETNDRKPLDPLTGDALALVQTNNVQGVPWIAFGGRFQLDTALPAVQLFVNKSTEEVVAALKDPTSPTAKAVLGAADVITAQICVVTEGKPATVCQSPGVTAASAFVAK